MASPLPAIDHLHIEKPQVSPSVVERKPLIDDPDADITFCSTDGDFFRLQRKHLEANTGAFPGSEFETRGEITHLTESTAVLLLLFQFVSPKRDPEVDNLDIDALIALAEAAEKYEVFHAMSLCKLQMKTMTSTHPLKVLKHASRHDYPQLIQEAVSHLVRLPTADVAELLPTGYVIPWIRYCTLWDSFFEDALQRVLDLRVVNHGPKNVFFTTSLQPQICHSCLINAVKTIRELKEIQTVKELKESLSKPRPALMGCLAASCQYPIVITSACTDIKAKVEQSPTFLDFIASRR